MKFYLLALLVVAMIVCAFAGPIAQEAAEKACSPHLGYCAQTTQCCPGLVCLSYAAKCVQKGGLIIPE